MAAVTADRRQSVVCQTLLDKTTNFARVCIDVEQDKIILLHKEGTLLLQYDPNTGEQVEIILKGEQIRAIGDFACYGGLIVMTDFRGHRLLLVDPTSGRVCHLAGSKDGEHGDCDGSLHEARFFKCDSIDVDINGVFYFADYGNNKIRSLNLETRKVATVGTVPKPFSCCAQTPGVVYSSSRGKSIYFLQTDTDKDISEFQPCLPTIINPGFDKAYYIVQDSERNMYIADRCCIRSIDTHTGEFHTVLGQDGKTVTESVRVDGRGEVVEFQDYICMAIDSARDMIYVVDGCDRGSSSGPLRRIFLSTRSRRQQICQSVSDAIECPVDIIQLVVDFCYRSQCACQVSEFGARCRLCTNMPRISWMSR
eukprot:192734_1